MRADLGARHRHANTTVVALGASHLAVLSTRPGEDFGPPGPRTLSRVTRSTGEVEELMHGRGSANLTAAPDGSVYVEFGRMFLLPAEGEPTPLPQGLSIW